MTKINKIIFKGYLKILNKMGVFDVTKERHIYIEFYFNNLHEIAQA